jgi:hypothetical protein
MDTANNTATQTTATQDMNRATAMIARKFLGLDTLEERRSDSLDFHDLSVVGIRRALEAAYKAGKEAR